MVQLTDDCFRGDERLMPLDEALALLADRIIPVVDRESVALAEAGGRVLAADIVSALNVPPHDNSAVDGYAVRQFDLPADGNVDLEIVDRAAAGHPASKPVSAGQAVRIFTGAAMPEGGDSVFMQEDVEASEDGTRVVVPAGLKAGANRRKAGEDICNGDTILTKGRRLRPQDLGLAASIGTESVQVFRTLKAAIFSTGDEVREPGQPLAAGDIYDANRFVLRGLIEKLGVVVTDLGILPDDEATIRAALEKASHEHDVILTSGGVSVGEEDHIKPAVEALGSLHFWRLAVKPGRPVALGQVGKVPFVGLPGNPAAAMVTFLRFARPMILQLAGDADTTPLIVQVRAGFSHKKKIGRREWVRASIAANQQGLAEAQKFPREGAGILSSISGSDGLVELPEEMTQLEPGDMVDFISFNEVGA
ncbi:MAG: molybdopterin molybdotransferase MoeA [Alphaproteobacteria bacterium]|jgi:molybdopterin molybdotransferase|nr:molybdopterin molybdotransferase MoeA [Alphaproteobacteria bacterium]MBT4964870.1 molybdopterin molybdotransferase MoeA [Alphaproteobacteria bacterium]MBT5161638.1 molybdopterin molybdotransferase MoeA [Alphaproteobacteria bacterium]MBT5919092.1 molybdopterin molybdotransferase MoeA [Alphaproteobacteria bacterium]MBT6384731.1 molybdopterin molybdotransferase MoeA [Alphaproteobacteria bacterium]